MHGQSCRQDPVHHDGPGLRFRVGAGREAVAGGEAVGRQAGGQGAAVDFPREERALDLDFLAEQGTITPGDQNLIDYAETAEEAWGFIQRFYELA